MAEFGDTAVIIQDYSEFMMLQKGNCEKNGG